MDEFRAVVQLAFSYIYTLSVSETSPIGLLFAYPAI